MKRTDDSNGHVPLPSVRLALGFFQTTTECVYLILTTVVDARHWKVDDGPRRDGSSANALRASQLYLDKQRMFRRPPPRCDDMTVRRLLERIIQQQHNRRDVDDHRLRREMHLENATLGVDIRVKIRGGCGG